MANQSSMASSQPPVIKAHELLMQQLLASVDTLGNTPKNDKDFKLHHTTLMTLVKAVNAYCTQQNNLPHFVPLSGYGHKVVCYFYQSPHTPSKQDTIPLNLGVFATYSSAIEALEPHQANPYYAGYFISEEGNHE